MTFPSKSCILAMLLASCSAKTSMTGWISDISNDNEACASHMNGKLPQAVSPDFHFSGNVRQYYVAAEEELWNYAPTGWDNWLGLRLSQSPRAKAAGYLDYGTIWEKALYRGYTDASFNKRSSQPPWQGTQGPTIRAEQGDMVEIMFVNKLSKNYASMHSMGLAYNKENEGSDYPNATYPNQPSPLPVQGAVPPGSCVVYKWLVNTPEGPNLGEPARTHVYHSFVSYRADTNAGLIGPTIIYAPGKMASTMANYREFPVLYNVFDESQSFLSGENKARLTGSGNKRDIIEDYPVYLSSRDAADTASNMSYYYPQLVNYNSSMQFSNAPQFYSINGYVFANNPLYDMCFEDQVIWYVYAYGSASHVFHMHGNGFTSDGIQMDAISLNNGEMKTLCPFTPRLVSNKLIIVTDMNATGIGQWQVLCHVANHMQSGMQSNYRVQPSRNCTIQP